MPGRPAPLALPTSYADLGLQQLKVSNHPANAPGVTPIQIVTLYRPNNHNAFTMVMRTEMEDLWGMFDVDDRVKVIICTGHGRMFCAGADLDTGFHQTGETVNDHRDGGGRVAMAIHRCRKPTIGALNGSAVGIGITMTLPMAIRIAYKDAKIGFVFARRGLVMEAASSFFLPKLIGNAKTMHLITTGSVYRASDKLYEGLFTETLERADDVLPRAIELASEIADNCSNVSWALMRDLIWRPTNSAEEQHLLDSRIIYHMFSTADNKEGVKSFMEKRQVNFKGTLETDAPSAYPWWTPIDITPRAAGRLPGGAKL